MVLLSAVALYGAEFIVVRPQTCHTSVLNPGDSIPDPRTTIQACSCAEFWTYPVLRRDNFADLLRGTSARLNELLVLAFRCSAQTAGDANFQERGSKRFLNRTNFYAISAALSR